MAVALGLIVGSPPAVAADAEPWSSHMTATATDAQTNALTGAVRGTLPGGRWTKVLWGWGDFTVDYAASVDVAGGEYRAYSAPFPFPVGAGTLPRTITHRVIGYGDVWLHAPVDATYTLIPV